jgi:hypothetical protein
MKTGPHAPNAVRFDCGFAVLIADDLFTKVFPLHKSAICQIEGVPHGEDLEVLPLVERSGSVAAGNTLGQAKAEHRGEGESQ